MIVIFVPSSHQILATPLLKISFILNFASSAFNTVSSCWYYVTLVTVCCLYGFCVTILNRSFYRRAYVTVNWSMLALYHLSCFYLLLSIRQQVAWKKLSLFTTYIHVRQTISTHHRKTCNRSPHLLLEQIASPPACIGDPAFI